MGLCGYGAGPDGANGRRAEAPERAVGSERAVRHRPVQGHRIRFQLPGARHWERLGLRPGCAGPGAGTWHYNGKWAYTPTPGYELGSASAVPGMTEPWSVGFAVGTPLSVLERWSGTRWAQVKS